MEFLRSSTATLASTHSVGGNPVRMTSGAITIAPDDEWRHDISRRDRIVTTMLALPMLRRYGLPVRDVGAPNREVTRIADGRPT